jgi:hypothetical protein
VIRYARCPLLDLILVVLVGIGASACSNAAREGAPREPDSSAGSASDFPSCVVDQRSPEPSPKICDGSDQRTLSVRTGVGGLVADGSMVLYENGDTFLQVTGQCRYWIGGYVVRTGQFSETEADEFGRDLFYGQWQSRCLVGSWHQDAVFDVPNLIFSDGADPVAVTCLDDSPIAGLPEEIRSMRQAWNAWVPRLAQAAERVDGPVRIVALVGFQHFEPTIPVATWPLSWPLSSIAVDVDEDPNVVAPGRGESLLISDPAEVSAIRAIWDEYLSGAHGEWFKVPPVPFKDRTPANDAGSEKLYRVFVRDTTPFEDERGLIPAL